MTAPLLVPAAGVEPAQERTKLKGNGASFKLSFKLRLQHGLEIGIDPGIDPVPL